MKSKNTIKNVVVQTSPVPIMRCLTRAISSVILIPSIKTVKGDVEGTDVRFVTRLSVLHMGLLMIDSMIDA